MPPTSKPRAKKKASNPGGYIGEAMEAAGATAKGELPPTKDAGIVFDFHWRKFQDQWCSAFSASSLGSKEPDTYLYNRLWNAFSAGFEAAQLLTPPARSRK